MVIEREITINSSIKKAWQVLGPEFANAYKWGSAINHSEGSGTGINGATCSHRGCDVSGMGKIKEEIIKYSEDNHLLSYQINEGMPSMVKYATNTWQLTEIAPKKTILKMKMELTVGGLIGLIMKPMMKMKMGKMATNTADDFKHYVETDKPHPRKIKAIKKYNS